ncbi:MAG: hypothetical protein M3081_16460, partial [Gemmatimonadota bacterium]|nr:hypothetical protein [Gemmatimonadota bacterium]
MPTTLSGDDATQSSMKGWERALAGVVALYAVVYALWHMVPLGALWRVDIADLAFLPVRVAIAILAWRVWRIEAPREPPRRLWGAVSIAFALGALGAAVAFVRAHWLHDDPWVSWTNAPYLLFFPVAFWGMLGTRGSARTARERARVWLDGGTVVVAGTMVCWYFVLRPAAVATNATSAASFIAVIFPLCYL